MMNDDGRKPEGAPERSPQWRWVSRLACRRLLGDLLDAALATHPIVPTDTPVKRRAGLVRMKCESY